MKVAGSLDKVKIPLRNAALSLLLIRLFLAYEWLNSGTGKIQSILANADGYFTGMGTVLGSVWPKTNPYPFMVDFLTNIAAPNTSTMITMVAIAETLVGISLLLGFITRIGAFGGIVLNAIFYLAAGHTSPSTAGINLIMIGAQLATIVAPGGRVFGIDTILHRKAARIPIW